jgi:glutamate-1-semialdehyde 2,1-aminomutase
VNSPVRSFKAVGGEPLFISRAKGPLIFDADGNSYIDYVGSWGALILGHAFDSVVRAVKEQAELGTSYGAPTELEVELAEMILKAVPSMKMVRFVNSGTEATMSAVRLARGYTNRNKIVKFEGCYHGHADYLLVKGGSGLATFALPNSAGVPDSLVKDTLVLPYNDITASEKAFAEFGEAIAGVIVEPVAANMGLIPGKEKFLRLLRKLTEEHDSLLIFDEVITGFRVAYGGAQTLYQIEPDLTCLGKIIGGGLPVGAYGGREEIMRKLSPLGPVYQAGTLAGNPLTMAAGIATLKELNNNLYERLEDASSRIADGIGQADADPQIPFIINRVGSMLGLFFTGNVEINNYSEAVSSDGKAYSKFFWNMLEGGVYLPPSPFETIFVSASHSDSEIEKTISAAKHSLELMAN